MIQWRKSSRSADTGQHNCVEVARLPCVVGVRDSKSPEAGYLTLSVESFSRLIAQVKRNELSL